MDICKMKNKLENEKNEKDETKKNTFHGMEGQLKMFDNLPRSCHDFFSIFFWV